MTRTLQRSSFMPSLSPCNPERCHPRKSGVQAPPPGRAPQAAPSLMDTRLRGYDNFHSSLLDEQHGRRLDQCPQALEETRGVMTVDHAMIEGGRQVHRLPWREAAITPDGPDDDLVDAHDRHFRPIDDRRRNNAAEAPERSQRDGGARELVARRD